MPDNHLICWFIWCLELFILYPTSGFVIQKQHDMVSTETKRYLVADLAIDSPGGLFSSCPTGSNSFDDCSPKPLTY